MKTYVKPVFSCIQLRPEERLSASACDPKYITVPCAEDPNTPRQIQNFD